MRLKQWIHCITTGLMISGNALAAEPDVKHEQLQMPQCLASKLTLTHQVLAENQEFQIIDMLASDINELVRLVDKVQCGRFINVSSKFNDRTLALKKQQAKQLLQKSLPALKDNIAHYKIAHQQEVEQALKTVDSDNIWQTLTHLTSYYNRSATSKYGVEAAKWLQAQFQSMATEYGRKDTQSFFVETGWYKQPSLVTVIGKDLKGPAVVIGAHIDTLDGRKPGAGDDGSGTSSLMEAARVLLSSDVKLKHPVYVIWYAAEERGLVGSQYVVQHFLEKGIKVKAVAQFDMTGYRVKKDDPTMWVFTDYTDKKLSNFVAELIDTYVKVPVDYSQCGYGCSDHASWTEEGIPSAFPCESNFDEHNPYIHTESDTMDLLSLEHMTNFSKLAAAFAMELALD